MKELLAVLAFQAKTIPIDEIILPIRNINSLKKPNKLWALHMNNTLAQESANTQATTKWIVMILDVNFKKVDFF